MIEEPYYAREERKAGEALAALMAKPLPESSEFMGADDFNPWDLFPSVYGTYSSEFDEMAVEVLTEMIGSVGGNRREDLGAEMFREMLCTANLCDYGSSPRRCFPTPRFKELLPALVEKWKAYYTINWQEPFPEPSEQGKAAI